MDETSADRPTRSFISRLLPAPVGGGFSMQDHWVWCGSVIRGEDGLYHMFASVWDKRLPFAPNWVTNSRVVRAESQTPVGPYRLAGDALPPRGAEFWDGRMTHNPTIHRGADGRYLLFYTGTTYDEPIPVPGADPEKGRDLYNEAHRNQRIGLAVAEDVHGPWHRMNAPILCPRPGLWDGLITTNPAPLILPDGSLLLAYKSVAYRGDLLRYGIARANRPEGPYERLSDEPIFRFDETGDHIEDAYLWFEDGEYQMIMKDMNGGLGGQQHGGVHARSDDGVRWHLSDPPQAYSRTVRWDDGSMTVQGSLERPQLLIENNHPTHVFFATGDGPGGFWRASHTWNMVVPLRR